jgi:hypothetical protein
LTIGSRASWRCLLLPICDLGSYKRARIKGRRQMPIDEAQKIPVLMAEYNTLRSETTTRAGHGLQIAGFSITALSIWAAEETTVKTWLALAGIIFL